MNSSQQQKARDLQALNSSGIDGLPNVWDVGSAVLIARAGASVIATTSAGVSWAWGGRTGPGCPSWPSTRAPTCTWGEAK